MDSPDSYEVGAFTPILRLGVANYPRASGRESRSIQSMFDLWVGRDGHRNLWIVVTACTEQTEPSPSELKNLGQRPPSLWFAWMKRASSYWSKPGGRCRPARGRSPKKITSIDGPGHEHCSSRWSLKLATARWRLLSGGPSAILWNLCSAWRRWSMPERTSSIWSWII